jgi:hypothetical protein
MEAGCAGSCTLAFVATVEIQNDFRSTSRPDGAGEEKMSNGADKVCKGCSGKGSVRTPDNRMWQQCPLCSGSGANQQVFRVPFDYVWPSIVLTALGKLQPTLQIDQDSDFEWIWVVSDQTGAWNVILKDASTGRTLSNSPVNNDNFSGTAQLPFPLVEPYLIARSAVVSATVTDLSNAGNTVQLVFRGYKLFPVAAPQQGSSGMIVNQS